MTRTFELTLTAIRDALVAGDTPQATPEELPCFTPKALEGNPNVTPDDLSRILGSLGPADIPTLDFALEKLRVSGAVHLAAPAPAIAVEPPAPAITAEPPAPATAEPTAPAPTLAPAPTPPPTEPAWLGFKIVTDPVLAVDSVDTAVVGIEGKGQGSADALPGIFVATEGKEIVFGRSYSARDRFQMLDITRGPHMHNEQYAGVAWLSLPLVRSGAVYIFGAGEVAHYLERMARDCDFETIVIDDDAAYLNEERLPLSRRVLIDSLAAIPPLGIGASDYVLVLTRGHMHDPEALMHGIKTGAHYVGMMGCLEKNERVFALAQAEGITREQLETTHTPIGLKFGAKTPAELALCIVAELVKVRNDARKAQAVSGA